MVGRLDYVNLLLPLNFPIVILHCIALPCVLSNSIYLIRDVYRLYLAIAHEKPNLQLVDGFITVEFSLFNLFSTTT